nr:immunoglobulin light chain junction region [Macaca mulatta]
CQETSDLYSF